MPQDAAQEQDDSARQAALLEVMRTKSPGERIAFLRKEKNWSQNQLASAVRDAGAPCSGKWKVCRWESGQNHPREPARRALAQVFGVAEAALFDNP